MTAGAARALVVAPHADDEAIGCGGTIRRLAALGWTVEIVVVTAPEPAEARAREHAAALACLGARGLPALGYPQQAFHADPEAVRRLYHVLRGSRPRLVLAPHRDELDRDHREVHRLVRGALAMARALQDPPTPWLLEYEVWTALGYPDVLVDISAAQADKRRAIESYPSQLVRHDYTAGALGLNAYRGAMLGPGRGLCEAFARPALPNQRPEPELEALCTPLA